MSKTAKATTPEAPPKRDAGRPPKPEGSPHVEVQVSMGCTDAEKAGLVAEAKKIKGRSLSNHLRIKIGWKPIT
jgi:hypothetical protein